MGDQQCNDRWVAGTRVFSTSSAHDESLEALLERYQAGDGRDALLVDDEQQIRSGRREAARGRHRHVQTLAVSGRRKSQRIQLLTLIEGMGGRAEPNQRHLGDGSGISRLEIDELPVTDVRRSD